MVKIQKSIKNISKYDNYPICKPSSNSGYLSANLTFWALNMATKRPYSKGELPITNGNVGHSPRGAEGEHLIHKNVI
jgi:hypothetical protein